MKSFTPEQIQIIEDGKKILNDLYAQRASINKQLHCGIITPIDAANELKMLDGKDKRIKKQMVLSVHVTESGRPRTIKYQESKELWCTIMADKKKMYAKSESALIEKLFAHYNLSIINYSLSNIFKLALEEKTITENNDKKTLSHYTADYERFITKDFGKKDIRKLTKTDLKKYTQELVTTTHPSKKAFFKYKSVLNLTFRYAVQNDIIMSNPVDGINNNVYYKSCAYSNPNSENKIFSDEEIKLVQDTVRKYMTYKTYKGYFINGYAILLSIETGMRAAELPALKWSDVDFENNQIHIHAQQLYNVLPGGKEYYYAPWTKNEKGVPNGGRYFPLTDAIKDILVELKEKQEERKINAEYILCHEDGDWIKTDAYESCLRRLLKTLGFKITNNHAFRMSLNSNVFIPLNIPVTDRARLLGHSVETNLKYYSYARKDNIDDICSLLNNQNKQVSPRSHFNVVLFDTKKPRIQ